LIRRKSPGEIERIRASCQIVYRVQQALEQRLEPGVTSLELDTLAEEIICAHGGVPAFKGYRGFSSSICASVNAQIVHGIPDAVPLREGDIISVDVGVRFDGYYGDAAFTAGVGRVDARAQHLIDVTRECLERGISQARPDNRLSDISHAIQTWAESQGLSVVRQFGGHGIGRSLHEEPHIDNYGSPGTGPRLRPGFVFAIEPILSLGVAEVLVGEDGWTTTTRDGEPAAHCEHTIAVTQDGPDILTLPTPVLAGGA